MSFDIVDMGASELSSDNVVVAQCQGSQVDDDEAPDYGEVPVMFGLGFAARPAPADEDGNAQGIVATSVPGFEAVCVGAFDPRSTETYKELGPGETAVFATGKEYNSRLLCKDQQIAMVVGDDTIIAIDRRGSKIAISGFGATIELSRQGGIVLAQGGAAIIMRGGTISLVGNVVLGGLTPSAPVMAVSPAGAPVPAPGVFVGV